MNAASISTFDSQVRLLIRNLENGLRSGYSILQCFEIIAKGMPDPAQGDAQWIVNEVKAGNAFPDALNHWLTRTPGRDLHLIVATMDLQLEIGGNLADKLNLLGQIFEKRRYVTGG